MGESKLIRRHLQDLFVRLHVKSYISSLPLLAGLRSNYDTYSRQIYTRWRLQSLKPLRPGHMKFDHSLVR